MKFCRTLSHLMHQENDGTLAGEGGVSYNFLSIPVASIKTQLKDVEIRPGLSVSLGAI